MSFRWNCSKCTYHHRFKSDRCCACGELRISKQQMSEFIQGVPIPDDTCPRNDNSNNSGKRLAKQATLAASAGNSSQNQRPSQTSPSQPRQQPKQPPKQQSNSTTKSTTNNNQTKATTKPKAAFFSNPFASQKPNAASTAPKPAAKPAQNTAKPVTAKPPNQTKARPPQNGSAKQTTQQPPSPNQNSRATNSSATAPNAAKPPQNRKRPPPAATSRQKRPSPPQQKRLSLQSPPYQPGPVPLDADASATWIFPKDDRYPRRDYQFDIARTAVLHNTLVGLPTGLGKTLIAAVVLYNYYRWFPTGKVVFMAPTLPLVNQQVKACYDIMGIPECDTAVLTGRTGKDKRTSIWTSRRAFFCTPQTMQNDIAEQRVNATHVVLIVLDEAHRAKGDYSYNKVVAQLEEAGAQFRVLGLSATPGSQIQAIQEVVTSLRINRLECRSDEDPHVKQYIHDRETEVVVVKKRSVAQTIETSIHNILGPHLTKLRQNGVLRYGGNATISHHQLFLAQKEYTSKSKQTPLYPSFAVARWCANLRNMLNLHGVGVVRGKVAEMEHNGMAQLTDTPEFQDLVKLVKEATHDPNQSNSIPIQEKTLNNPKLQKLQQILMEHFRRATEKKESSRAIVFSQLRDSVAEIEDVLKASRPVIQPRHFIGQGKGSTKTKDTTGLALKGMAQVEQQRVISEFKEGVYNTLICTCIGEEGLDIGEVDLIVNFDSLLSPVRMLQRVGRTGRKRNGRVVFLLSEGPEVDTYKKSKQKEKTLMRSMKQPNQFVVGATIPMLPFRPGIEECEMIQGRFHMSQVQGFGGDRSKGNNHKRTTTLASDHGWKLNADLEARRSAVLGESNNLQTLRNATLGKSLWKRFLSARLANSDAFLTATAAGQGRVWRLLRTFEERHAGPELRQKQRKRRGGGGRIHAEMDAFFPTTDSEDAFEALAWGKPEQRKQDVGEDPLEEEMEYVNFNTTRPHDLTKERPRFFGSPDCNDSNEMELPNPQKPWLLEEEPPPEKTSSPVKEHGLDQASGLCPSAANKQSAGTKTHGDKLRDISNSSFKANAVVSKLPSQSKPDVAQGNGKEDGLAASATTAAEVFVGQASVLCPRNKEDKQPATTKTQGDKLWDLSNSIFEANTVSKPPSPSEPDVPQVNDKEDGLAANATTAPEVFELPTQESESSSDEESEDDEDGTEQPTQRVVEKVDPPKENTSPPNAQPENNIQPSFQDTEFVLPSQLSSSSEEDEDSDEEKEEKLQHLSNQIPPSNQHEATVETSDSDASVGKHRPPISKKRKRIDVEVAESPEKAVDPSSDVPNGSPNCRRGGRKQRLAIEDTPEENNVFGDPNRAIHQRVRQKQRSAIEDTPESSNGEQPKRDSFFSGGLVDTQNSEEKRSPQQRSKATRKRSSFAIEDTPTSSIVEVKDDDGDEDVLVDTQPSKGRDSIVNDDIEITCLVCNSGESPDEDPIFLCDGPGRGIECPVAVHGSCYSVGVMSNNPDDEWRCDPCSHRFQGGNDDYRCVVCKVTNGPLKMLVPGKWVHTLCRAASKAGAVVGTNKRDRPGDENNDANDDAERKKAKREARKKQLRAANKKQYSHFLHEEAEEDFDGEGDEVEEEQVLDIEDDEELHAGGFINDSSQLGFSPDALDNVDPENEDDDAVHRAVDLQRERNEEFNTPLLNHRMKNNRKRRSSVGSAEGLGDMAFIKSVLQHHKEGGCAEDIEAEYARLKAENSNNEETDDDEWPE